MHVDNYINSLCEISGFGSGGYDERAFLGAFAKLRKATISSVMSVCPSVRMEQLGSHWTDFHEICYLSIFLNSVDEIKLSLKSNNNNGYFT